MDGRRSGAFDRPDAGKGEDASARAAIETLIRDFWTERLSDSASALRRHFADDAYFRIIGGPPAMPGPWLFEGLPAVIGAVRTIDVNLEFLSFEIADIIVDGDEAAFRWHASLRNRTTGVVGDLAVFDLIRFRDGRFARYEEFLDTDGFRRLMTGEPQPPLARRANRMRRGLQDVLRDARTGRPPPLSRTESEARKAMLRNAFMDRVARGGAATADHWKEPCELHLIGDPAAVPFARSHFGIDAVRKLIEQVDIEFELLDVVLHKILVDGDRAAMHWTTEARHRGTSAIGRIESFAHVIVDGDRIVSVTEFFDTAAAAHGVEG